MMHNKRLILSFVLLLIFTLYTSIFFYTSQNKKTRIDNILTHHIHTLKTNYALFLDFFETTAVSTVNLIQNDKQILQILTDFLDADEVEKTKLRQKLYLKLDRHYETMKSYGVLQFHFVLPNNVTSLRMHKPSKYGDNLTDLKYSFRYANIHQKPINGLEEGKTSHGFRNVYPLKNNDNQHIGAVDISFAPEVIQNKLYNINKIHTHFLVTKGISNIRLWKRDDKNINYVESIENKNYISLMTQRHNLISNDKNLTSIISPFKERIAKNMTQEKTFSIYIDQDASAKVVTFLPIKNIQSQVISYLVAYRDDIHVHDTINDFLTINIFSFLGVTLLGLFLYLIIRKTYQLESQKRTYHYLSQHDDLTKLPNRTLLHNRLKHRINTAKKEKKKFSLLFLDIDNFKQINDTHGHKMGDKVLKIVGQRIKKTLGKQDTIARLGGDEFIIISQDIKDINDITKTASKIFDQLTQSIDIKSNSFFIELSIGASIYPDDSKSGDKLLMFADSAMYKAKRLGGNNLQLYSPELTKQLMEKVQLTDELRHAIKNDEFIIHYQTQISLHTDMHVGIEALVRWKKPNGKLICPDSFIPLAEETGIVVELDRLVMKKAITEYLKWKNEGLEPGKLSLNLSIIQLKQDDMIDYIRSLKNELNFDPKNIEFEITETQIMENPKQYIDKLETLKKLGFTLSIDDFGTGYSSLSYLKRLPIDKLKIDREFILDLHVDPNDKEITKAIIILAQTLNLKVVAEGIENEEQLKFLKSIGCDIVQGNFFSKPLDAESIKKYLETKKYNYSK